MTHQLFESKLWKAITAVASGIMTSLLYDLFSQTSYVLQQEGTQYILRQSNNDVRSVLLTALSVFLMFFIIWIIFIFIIQIGVKISKQLKFHKIERIHRDKLVNIYINAKNQTIQLKKKFDNEPNANSAKLQLRELASIIIPLHTCFCPHNLRMKVHIKDYFRNPKHDTFLNVINMVSKYEFLSLIELLNEILKNFNFYSNDDELMKNDCKNIAKLIDDLKNVVN